MRRVLSLSWPGCPLTALAFERLHVAHTCHGEPVNGGENLHRALLRDGANLGFGLFRKDHPLHAGLLSPRTCSIVNPSSVTTSSNGMPWLFLNHSLEAAT